MKILQAEKLAESLNTMLNAKGIVGFKIAYNLRKLNDELKEYYKAKQDLFIKYGKVNGDKIVIEKESDNFIKFMEEFKPFEKEECGNIEFKLFTEEELQNSELTAGQIIFLMENFMEAKNDNSNL